MRSVTSRTYIINKLIHDNNLRSYLEVGVSNPYVNFLDIRCAHKVAVDPCIECEYFSSESIEQFKRYIDFQMTSDAFFKQNHETFDIIFVDGDHSYEQSLKDLNNALKCVPVGGFVVLHDAIPVSFESTQWENFEKKQYYNGGVWKTVVSALRSKAAPKLQIGTFPYDFGVCVIKKLADKIPEIPVTELDYDKDFSIPAVAPVYNLREFYNKKVSYFTPLYNTPQKSIERTTKTLLNQTNPNWEWVMVDNSSNAADAARLEKFFQKVDDPRIKYFRFNVQTNGFIGRAKKYAANLCEGDYLAELDHDDLLMPDITDAIIKNGEGFDFIYSNCATVNIADNDVMTNSWESNYPEGFAMGYGAYRDTVAINPLSGIAQEFKENITPPINPKTIRRIVAVPNHIRIWAKKFYDSIGGHSADMLVADDYELIMRSFLSGGKFLHLDMLGYLQVESPGRGTYAYNAEIQVLVNAIAVASDDKIRQEFELRNMQDWAYQHYAEHFGFVGNYYENTPGIAGWIGFSGYQYWAVPTVVNADAANGKV